LPSNLSSFHKADLLQGAIIIFSSMFLNELGCESDVSLHPGSVRYQTLL